MLLRPASGVTTFGTGINQEEQTESLPWETENLVALGPDLLRSITFSRSVQPHLKEHAYIYLEDGDERAMPHALRGNPARAL
jgi:hypothetical protein